MTALGNVRAPRRDAQLQDACVREACGELGTHVSTCSSRAQTITVGPDPESVAPIAPVGRSLAHRGEHRRVRSAIRLVQLVVERRFEELRDPATRTPRRGAPRARPSKRRPRAGSAPAATLELRPSARGVSGMTATGTNGSVSARRAMWQSHVRQTPPASAGGEVVRVPLERDAELEEPLRVEVVAVRRGRGGEAERDDRRARAEPSLARDAHGEVEGEAGRVREQRVRLHAEVVAIRLAALADGRARSRGRAPPPHSRSPARCSRSTRARAREREASSQALHDPDRVGVDLDRRRRRCAPRRRDP